MDKINKFISQFTDEKIPNIEKLDKKYFLVEENLKVSEKIKVDAFSKGVFLGEERGNFQASPALIEMIAKKSDRKVFINKDAEWLFLCGRDVFEKSIVKKNVDKGLVLVQNEQDENLGFGKFVRNKKESMIKNILDKGLYLRKKN